MTEETLFELVRKTPEAERQALLERACAGNPELQTRVEALLKADAGMSPLSKQPLTIDATTGFEATHHYTSSEPTPGIIIASRYTLLERIGEGGMGEVWVAKQSEPVKRRVALKLIKAGMDSKSVLQRFEQERQALALMDHPNIAKVLDGGLTTDRRPFFVMELVNGAPLTKFCDDARLGIRERLEILIPICQAVQHAHQKGIVHRDLKPSNILITIIDGKPIPKIIYFGVAKATSGRLTDESLSTQFGSVVGTLEYMSPEQAGFSGEDIDTRADIYSLGVILYEMLTGLRPIDASRLKKAALTEMIRIIKEEEPSKPSTRLSTDDSAPSMAALRLTEPRKLSSLLRGELDWVVMKCLEKQRDRRYDTANALARDIQRFLANEAVEARPPSAGYRLKKLVARNKGTVMAAGLVLLALVAGMIGTSMGLLQAEKNLKQATENLVLARKGNEILGLVFVGLNPKVNYATVGELSQALKNNLKKAVEELDGSVIGDPLTVAQMQNTLGVSLLGLGDAKSALVVHTKALATRKAKLGEDHTDTLTSMYHLARAHLVDGQVKKALPLLLVVLEKRQAKLGEDHVDTLSSKDLLAEAYLADGQVKKALPLLLVTLEERKSKLGEDHDDTLDIMCNLAEAYKADGQVQQTIPLYEVVLEMMKAKHGVNHLSTLTTMNNLANVYQEHGQVRKAIPLLELTLDNCKLRLGEDHPETIASTFNLTSAYEADGQVRKAILQYEKILEKFKAKLGPDHPNTMLTMNNLANAYRTDGQIEKAIPLFQTVMEKFKLLMGEDHPKTLTSMNNLANTYRSDLQMRKAIPLLELTLEKRKTKLGEAHPETLHSIHNLAIAHYFDEDMRKAIPLLELVLEKRRAKLGENHIETLTTRQLLGSAYIKDKQRDKAMVTLAQVVSGIRKPPSPDDVRFIKLMEATSLDLLKCEDYLLSETILRECLAIREKKAVDNWRTYDAQSMLGTALLGQKKYAAAEPLLVKGYEGMKQREKNIPRAEANHLSESLDHLIHFYTETNKPDQVQKWQAEKERLPKVETIKK